MPLDVSPKPNWVIITTKAASEDVAERALRQAGYRVYLPRFRKLLRPHGSDRRGQPTMRPLFTGYLFAHDWHGWPDTPITGVVGLMRQSGRVVELLDADVMRLWDRERALHFDDVPSPRSHTRRTDLAIGAAVEFDLLDQRIEAALVDLTDSGKAIVRGLMFARESTWTVDASTLRAISA